MNNEEGGFAKPNMEKLGEAISPKEMGRGGAELSAGESGPGVRAAKLQSGSEKSMHKLVFKEDEPIRFTKYRRLVNALINGKITDDEAQKRLEEIYASEHAELEQGGFLGNNSKIRVINNLETKGQLTKQEAETLRNLVLEEKTTEKAPTTVWDATVDAINKEGESNQTEE